MAGSFLQIQYDDHLVLDALRRLSASAANLEPAFEDIGEALLLSHANRWRQMVDADGNPWHPLSEAYRQEKPKNKDKILVLDGYLERLHYDATPDGLKLGTDRIYGAVQQFGAKKGEFGVTSHGVPIPWGDIPARPFLGVSEDDKREILDILSEHLMGSFR
ncbi:MAG: phage virion morphogenesis protein [Methylococcaceae bacterium]|nr:phage virion morphogenesis protein [Methylococcaceae bacterium]